MHLQNIYQPTTTFYHISSPPKNTTPSSSNRSKLEFAREKGK
jgi:hypothetical protein